TAGTYTVSITGDFPAIQMSESSSANADKLMTIEQWGAQEWETMNRAFFNCSNLQGNFDDTPDLSQVTDMFSMFSGASSFNQDIGDWNVANVTDMSSMFSGASSFNQDIGDWNVANVTDMSFMFEGAPSFDQDLGDWNVAGVTDMTGMFDNASLSTDNYDALLIGWNNENLQSGVSFSGGNSQYCSPEAVA